MAANEAGIADLHEWIIDLEVKEVFHAAGLQFLDEATIGERGERAAVAVGTEEEFARGFQQQPPALAADRGHRSLLKELHLIGRKPEVPVLSEEITGGCVGGRAGHDEEGEGMSVAAAESEDLLRVNLVEGSPGNRAGGEHPLGLEGAQPAPLSPRHE